MANTIRHKRGTTRPTASDISTGELAINTVEGKIFTENDSGHIFEAGELLGAFSSSTITYTVTVASKTSAHRYNGTGSSNGYKINGVFSPFLNLAPGNTYKFDQADSSNSGHPFRFYLEADKSTAYTTNVTTSGTPGSAGAYTLIVITDTTPLVLHYQCSAHGYMGNSVLTNSKTVNYNDLQNQPSLFDGNYNSLSNRPTIPTATSQLTNDSGFITSSSASDVSSDTSPQLGGDLDVNGQDITSASNGNIDLNPNGSGLTIFVGNSTRGSGSFKLNCEQNSHGITIKGPPHSAAASYTFTFPNSISNGQFLTTDSNGNTSWATPANTNTQLSNEEVQDIVGGMVSSNTESGITVTYQDSDGTLDFSVASQTDENFTTTLKNKLDGIAANATNVTNNNQLTNGAGYITSAALAGASDGGNAALLDGVDSTQFLRADQDDTTSGNLTLSSSSQDVINLSANSTNDNRGIAFNSRTAVSADYNDGYLRLNNNSEFSNGVYTPLVMRADGGFNVDGTTVINGSAQLIASRLTGALPAIDGSALTGITAGLSTSGGTLTGELISRDIKIGAGYHLKRSDHHTGHLEGSYNNIGGNAAKSNPIYTIGSSYNPVDASLSNMYGIGYSNGSNANFLPSTGGWGLYVAADGDSRIFLDGSYGRVYIGTNGRYLSDVGGDYGSVQVNGSGGGGWEGFSIDGRMVFMHNGSDEVGIYNDVDNHWMLKAWRNSSLYLYHANNAKLQTTSTGIDVTGRIDINDSNTRVEEGSNNALRIQTNSGYVDIGPMNTTYAHFQTDRGTFYFNTTSNFAGHVRPHSNNTYDLGSSSNRWRNIYTNDLNLSNEGGANSVDGTWGDWTIQEGEDTLYMLNNRNGKKYKMNLTEVS